MVKRVRPVYEPPRARDLSGLGVVGQLPLGECTTGAFPYTNCLAGPGFFSPCTEGATADTSRCSNGTFHNQPTCAQGRSAVTICLSGQQQNF